MAEKYVIGLDYGTESVRSFLVNLANGQIISSAVFRYPDGVLVDCLPGENVPLPPDYALQNPADWLMGLETTIKEIIKQSGIEPVNVIGLGIDFTSCTILPVTQDGLPLSKFPEFRKNPHAWAKLWKHHAAQGQADRVNKLAGERKEPWLSLYGGKISSEWFIPKALQIYEEAPNVYESTNRLLEAADWVAWQLTGNLVRNTCGAGYKANWNKEYGYPSYSFLESLASGFGNLFKEKCPDPVLPPGSCVGHLTQAWADRLGLDKGISIAVGIIDAHSAAIGAGITQPGTMFLTMGTSTCHMLLAEQEIRVPGISGVVEDGIVPGLFGYEAGQAGVGDIFAWFIETCVPISYYNDSINRGISIYDLLDEKAKYLRAGGSGLLALDWWNGCRTPLVDANLSGLLLGATLATTPEEIYRSLIEATAFGTRLIIESFTKEGIGVDRLLAGGGLTKNSLLMQIYADVIGNEVSVSGLKDISALGAAMLASVAAGPKNGGYPNLSVAAKYMAPDFEQTFTPDKEAALVYDRLYKEYCKLFDYFGRGNNPVMETLRKIKNEVR